MRNPQGKTMQVLCFMTECIHNVGCRRCELNAIYLDYEPGEKTLPVCSKFQVGNEPSVEDQIYH